MPESVWDPDQYERFRLERAQPFYDLMSLVEARPAMRVLDLGCGTGELTRILHDRLDAAETVGIDVSATMLARAEERSGGGVSFVQTDIVDYEPDRPVDLVFSNAALHWIDDHETILERFTAMLAADGQLAVQIPYNFHYPTNTVAVAVAGQEPFRADLDGYVRSWPQRVPAWYAEQLHRLGFARQNVRQQVYLHLLDGREDLVEWVKGTLLTPYKERLSGDAYADFLDCYQRRLMDELPDQRPFPYAFNRILFWGAR